MVEKNELNTFTEAKKNEDQICFIQVQRRMSRSYYIISAFQKNSIFIIYLHIPSFLIWFVIKIALFWRAMFV